MNTKIYGYRELLKALVEYHITLIERLAREGYDKIFSILLLPCPDVNEEKLREIVLPLLRSSDRLFYIDGNLIALLPGSDWTGAMHVRETIMEALGLQEGEREYVVEYPQDGTDAFSLISNLYAQYDEFKAGQPDR